MTSNTANLQLPFLAVGQAQKHVTVNESLRRLDAMVQLSVVSATTTAEEIACTAAGRALIAGAAASNQRTTLGLGTAAVQNTGTSGANVPLLNGANTWSGSQSFTSGGELFATTGSLNVNFRGDTGNNVTYERSGSSAGGVNVNLNKSRGTVASRSNVATNDALGVLAFNGWGDGSARPGAQIGATALAATPSATDMQAELTLATSGAGSITPSVRLRVRETVIRPGTDNAASLGDASFRWTEVFAAAGTINTSDAREKTELRALLPAENRAVKRVVAGIGAFQRLASVARKGEEARLHIGVTAQAVEAAFAAEGLDARRYGLFCVDAVEGEDGQPAGERLGVRHDQLFALALAAMFAA